MKGAAALAGLLLLAACGDAGDGARAAGAGGSIAVFRPRLAAPLDTALAAAYLVIRNAGARPDTLVGVTSPEARTIRVHGRGMRPLARFVVPADTTIILAPGGTHLMLEGLRRLPVAGDSVTLTFTFRHAGVFRATVPVVRYEDIEP